MVALLILDKNIRYFLGKGLKVITLQIIQFEVVGIKKNETNLSLFLDIKIPFKKVVTKPSARCQ
ncbi:hypothetical protein CQA01_37650 [Cyclobacterium qasimii]|uniref:Uncharacterized protein n=1 Tax=Cyclobacterium qasimii TaxID=1350429 RepID=A0A512CG72_9BACT|nr:hypothetical protein CQA01_37650 [Cyclobacterium qasimii]